MSTRRPGSPTCCAASPTTPPAASTSCCPGTGARRQSRTRPPRNIPSWCSCRRSCRLHAVSLRPWPDAYDFVAGSRFAAPGVEGVHPVHDTQTKRLRHLNFFQHECYLEVRTPRVKLPDGRVVQIEPDWFGKLSGFTLLFEALVLPWPSR